MKSLFSSLMATMLLLVLSTGNAFAQVEEDSMATSTDTEMTDGQTLVQLASENENLSTLVAALKAAGYDAPLGDASASFTVFAPTNDAFDALPAGVLDNLLKEENANTLKYLLMYHVSPDLVSAENITTMLQDSENGEISPETLHGNLTVRANDGTVMIMDAMNRVATVTEADITASNGYIHLIDKVLVPSNVDVSTLATDPEMAMEALEKDAEATANGAWAAVKNTGEEVGNAMGNTANEVGNAVGNTASDVGNAVGNAAEEVAETASNAYQGAKEEVEETANEMSDDEDMEDMDAPATTRSPMGNTANASIGEIAKTNSDFSTLSAALKSADLENLLNSNSEFTVFAPSNDAFNALPDSVSSSLMQESNQDMLKNVLSYHVVASKISAADLVKAIEKSNGFFRIQTMGSSSLIASMDDNGNVVLTDGNGEFATITDTDIEASNGVVHVIDGVLTPRN